MKSILSIASLVLLFASCRSQSAVNAAPQFAFPDEWDVHEGTILIFPAQHSYGREAAGLQRESALLANALVAHEPVVLFVHSDDVRQAEELVDPRVDLRSGPEYRIDWARDTAPMIVRNAEGERRAVCFQFNGWGEKYEYWQDDVGVNLAIARELGIAIERSDLVLEGGALEIGRTDLGLMAIATEQCVLHPNRGDWPKERIEHELMEKLGIDVVVWVKEGLNPDPITDGHIDGLLKFVGHNTVLLHTTDNTSDRNYASCLDAKRRLEERGLRVIELPLADDIVHMNFYIGSGGDVVYVPVCGDPEQDDPALQILETLFARVIPVEAIAMGKAGGGVHCFTQQIPAATGR